MLRCLAELEGSIVIMKDMTKGSPFGLIIRFVIPLLLGNLLQQLYNIADAAIVGRFLGPGALAAVGATGSVQFLIIGFCLGACSGFCVPIAQRFGAGEHERMRRLLYNSVLLTAVIAAVATIFTVTFCNGIMRILSTPEDIWADTRSYILVIFLGIPFTLMYNLAAGVLRSVGDSRTPFLVLAVSTVSNIFLDIFCIAVLKWGCAGAAIATVASQALSGGLCVWVIIKKYEILHIRAKERRADRRTMRELLMIGVPMGLQFSITAIGSMVLQSANNGLGSVYTSTFTAVSRVKMFAMCPFDAVASGVATFCSQNYGAGNYKRIRTGYKLGIIMVTVYSIVCGVLLGFFGRTACMLFVSSKETQILDLAGTFFRIQAVSFWTLGLLNVSRITTQGLGFTGRATFSGAMEMIARIAVVFLFVPGYGFTGICLGDPMAWVLADLYIVPTTIFVLKKIKRDLSGHETQEHAAAANEQRAALAVSK